MKLKRPDTATISPGQRYLYRAKIGGERQLLDVITQTAPYPKDIGKGRVAQYCRVYGYGWKGEVQVKKLFVYPRNDEL